MSRYLIEEITLFVLSASEWCRRTLESLFAPHLDLGRWVCAVIQLPGNCQQCIRTAIWNYNSNEHKKCWQIHEKWETVNNTTVGWFQSDDTIPINSNPRFPKRPMSNWLSLTTVMIKFSPIGMWMMQAKRQLPNNVYLTNALSIEHNRNITYILGLQVQLKYAHQMSFIG